MERCPALQRILICVIAVLVASATAHAQSRASASAESTASAVQTRADSESRAVATLQGLHRQLVESARLAQSRPIGPMALELAQHLELQHAARLAAGQRLQVDPATLPPLHESTPDAGTAWLADLQGQREDTFEAAWLAAVARQHEQMLQVIDDQLVDDTTSVGVRAYLERGRDLAARQRAITSTVVALTDAGR